MNVLMIYPRFPEETFWNSARSAKAFRHCTGMMPPLGLLTIASYLPRDFEVRLADRNVSEESEADWSWADVVFLSAMLSQRADYEACVTKARTRGKPIAVGGPFTHARPEQLLSHADWICLGEAESIMDELVADIRAGRRHKQYQGGNTTDMEQVRLPRFDLVPNLRDYSVMAIQFSRGCPFRCEFCDIIEIYGRVPRTKTPAQVCVELAALKELGFRGFVFVVDDNFIGNKKKAKVLLKELVVWNRENGQPFAYFTEASLNVADDVPLLHAMFEAGFLRVFIGIETPDPKLLKATLKDQNIPGNPLERLRRVREHGIHVTAGFIVGFDGEPRGVFEAQRSFIQASGIGVVTLGLLQALPDTQLSRRLEKEGRLLSDVPVSLNWSLEGLNFVPKGEITKREYLAGYQRLVRSVFEPRAFFERILPALLTLKKRPLGTIHRLSKTHASVFFLQCYHLGVKSRGSRVWFWKTLLQVLWKNPTALEAFGYDSYYFYHLNRHADDIDREISSYLASPPPGDVLDEVIRDPVTGNFPALGPLAAEVAAH